VIVAAAQALENRIDAALRIPLSVTAWKGWPAVASQGTSTSKSSSLMSSRLSM
jgi:hypothetical protein